MVQLRLCLPRVVLTGMIPEKWCNVRNNNMMPIARDIAIGEAVERLGEAVSNMEKEIALREDVHVVEDDRMSMEAPRRSLDSRNSVDSTSSSSKRRKKDKDSSKGNEISMSSDPFFDLASGMRADLNKASHHFGRMAEAMEMEAKVQQEANQKDKMQERQENSITELTRLGFTGSELLQAAGVFVKVPDQITMLFALPETLRREFIKSMIACLLFSFYSYCMKSI